MALPSGKRRTELQRVLNNELVSLFANRVLAFGERSAEAYAHVVTGANTVGNPIDFAEHNFILATRNERDFKGTPVKLLNPWS
jgi:toxin FitB